jgi:hypothetical protein
VVAGWTRADWATLGPLLLLLLLLLVVVVVVVVLVVVVVVVVMAFPCDHQHSAL